MAQKVNVVLVDDVDGGEASETVSFSLDGVSYEIDLNDANASKLRDALAPWVGHARRTSGRSGGGRRSSGGAGGSSSGGRRTASSRSQTAAVREWARSNGYDIKERGRIPAEVVAAYEKANG